VGAAALCAAGALAAFLFVPPPVSAQTIVGRVVEDGREHIWVAGAIVSLLDRDGDERTQALADSVGRFVLTPPQSGEYYIRATRIGYQPFVTPLLALSDEGSAPLELAMMAQPIGLDGFEVSVEAEAEEFLGNFGLTPASLGNRWIDRADIDAIALKQDPAAVISWQNIPGIYVPRPENLAPGSADIGLCVSFQKGRGSAGTNSCALNVLDGVAVQGRVAMAVDPETIEGIAILPPVEATTFYGTMGAGGAVVIWTRRGGAR
jgi:hypothetical protein